MGKRNKLIYEKCSYLCRTVGHRWAIQPLTPKSERPVGGMAGEGLPPKSDSAGREACHPPLDSRCHSYAMHNAGVSCLFSAKQGNHRTGCLFLFIMAMLINIPRFRDYYDALKTILLVILELFDAVLHILAMINLMFVVDDSHLRPFLFGMV